MTSNAVQINNHDRCAIGMLWLPKEAEARSGVLLCRPFGTEAVRSSMLFRTLGKRLSGEGHAVLCLDYHGTGESPSTAVDQTFSGWQSDILAADRFLREQVGVARCNWFGLGLGATLASRAALQLRASSRRPCHLVLWEPVENGEEYLQLMCAKHRRELERWHRSPWNVIRADIGEPEPMIPGEVLGFEVGASLAADIKAVKGLPIDELLAAGLRITAGRDTAKAPWRTSPRLRLVDIDEPNDWMTNHAPDGVNYRPVHLVPSEAIHAVLHTLVAPGPVLL